MDFMPDALQEASSSFTCKILCGFVPFPSSLTPLDDHRLRSHVQCTDPRNNGGALYLSAAERYSCLVSAIGDIESKLRRHDLVCCGLVNFGCIPV